MTDREIEIQQQIKRLKEEIAKTEERKAKILDPRKEEEENEWLASSKEKFNSDVTKAIVKKKKKKKINHKRRRNYFWVYFRPNLFVNRIENINLNIFKNSKFKLVLCDLDNTLVPHFTIFPTKTAIDFCRSIQEMGIKFVIVSNNKSKRVKLFAEKLGVDNYLAKAHKPFLTKINKFLAKNYKDISPEEMVFIGDQFIFDIITANRLQCRSILTMPIFSNTQGNESGILRLIENKIYKKLQLNNIFENKTIEMDDQDEIL